MPYDFVNSSSSLPFSYIAIYSKYFLLSYKGSIAFVVDVFFYGCVLDNYGVLSLGDAINLDRASSLRGCTEPRDLNEFDFYPILMFAGVPMFFCNSNLRDLPTFSVNVILALLEWSMPWVQMVDELRP